MEIRRDSFSTFIKATRQGKKITRRYIRANATKFQDTEAHKSCQAWKGKYKGNPAQLTGCRTPASNNC